MTTRTVPGLPGVIRIRTSRDVLATVPRLLGYRPCRSIVFLNLHDRQGVSTMRVDLPAPASAETERALSASLVGALSKVPGVRTTIVVVYADGPFDAGGDVPRASFIRPLIRALDAAGFDVHDALCVAGDAWGAYDGPDAGAPRPLDELDEPAPGEVPPEPMADISQLAELPAVDHLARRSFAHSWRRELRTRAVLRPVDEAEAALLLDPAAATSDELAALLGLLRHPELRDVVLFTWAWGAARGYELIDEIERIDAGEVGAGDATIALDLMGLGSAAPPDRGRIATAIELMARVAALAPDTVAPVALTVLAWLHWSQGRGSIAGRFVDRARRLDPVYGLAELLDTVLARGVLPEWAYVRPGGGAS